jgi:glucosyl-3-phosphoglycerate synthase
MEYRQERVATLHDLTGAVPEAPCDRATVVVPMTEREYGGLAAERVLSELERVDPARLVIPLRASPERVPAFVDWVTAVDVPTTVLWCDGPRLAELLDDAGLNGERGKGRDVWLALGQAVGADGTELVVVHDADTSSYDRSYVHRLLFPLAHGFDFSKGYYARVENDRLYGRLYRLFVAPMLRTLADVNDAPVLDYLSAFRYTLAGEFAATAELARRMRGHRSWGLEVGTLGEAFAEAGFRRSAQVDLGAYEHDHRAVSGPTGLSDMSRQVGAALFTVVEEHGVAPDYETLPERYRETARQFVRAYGTDAAFNGLDYPVDEERSQVDQYAEAIVRPVEDTRLPPWADAPIKPADVRDRAVADLREVCE